MNVVRSVSGTVFPGPLNLHEIPRACPSAGRAKGTGRVYAIETGGGVVKIGVTSNPFLRFTSLSNDLRVIGGRTIGSAFVSESIANFRYIERRAHLHFRSSRVGGEYFRITLEAAISFIESLLRYVDFSKSGNLLGAKIDPDPFQVVKGFSTRIGLYSQRQARMMLGVSSSAIRMKVLEMGIEARFHPRSSGKLLTRDDVDQIAASLLKEIDWGDEPRC